MKTKSIIFAASVAALTLCGFSSIPHNITYNLNGGSATGLTEHISFWQNAELPTAAKIHEVFTGWTENDEPVTELRFTSSDRVLEANFVPEYYKVHLTDDDGNVVTTTMRKHGQVTDLMALNVKSLKADHPYENLVGWTNGNEVITTISAEGASDVTLSPVFEPKKYSIAYELNGGTNADNPATYAWGTGVESFADPAKDGYTFTGWFSDPDCTVKAESISADSHADVTLYAGWEAIPVSAPTYTGSAGSYASGTSAPVQSASGVVDPYNYLYIPAIGYKMSFKTERKIYDSPVYGWLHYASMGTVFHETPDDEESAGWSESLGSLLTYGDHNSDGLGPAGSLPAGTPVYLTVNGVTSVYTIRETYVCEGHFGELDNSRPRGYGGASFTDLGIGQRNRFLITTCTYDNTGTYCIFCS